MYVPLNWIKEYTSIELPQEEIISRIRSQLGEVESVNEYGSRYKNTVLGEIIKKEDHPNADKLGVYEVNIGEKNVTVVAGDKNLQIGDKVAYFAPGAKVPYNAYPEKFDGIVEAVKLRGVESNGMLASGRELDLNNNHEEVMVIDTQLSVGSEISEVLEMNDTVIEIENKALTNRADCFSIVGLAREIAGIQQIPYVSPSLTESKLNDLSFNSDSKLPLEVKNESAQLCKRYTAITISDIEIKDSPVWLQSKLVRAGMRPINNIVDITNYIMLLTGQPLHAFDYDKLVNNDSKAVKGAIITVRKSDQGESITTLDEKTHELSSENLMICDSTSPIAIAGVMGGKSTEIDEKTKNLVIESANFDMYNNRRTSMELGIFTDAVTRFSKGQDPNLTEPAIVHAVKIINELAGGKIEDYKDIYPDQENLSRERIVTVDFERMNTILGIELKPDNVITLLNNVELRSKYENGFLSVDIPTNRLDIKDDVDIHEEVARLLGYENIRSSLPSKDLKPVIKNPKLELKSRIRTILSNNNATEILTYNFVSLRSLTDSNLEPENSFKLKNPLSPKLQFMRTSLLPSLLGKVRKNIDNNFDSIVLYEINKSHNKNVLQQDRLPAERENISLIFSSASDASKLKYGKSPYYSSKYYLEKLFDDLYVEKFELVHPERMNKENLPIWISDLLNMFDPNAVAVVIQPTEVGDIPFGVIGEPSPSVISNFKIPRYSSMFEIDLEILLDLVDSQPNYQEPSNFPYVSYDVCYILDADVPYSILESNIKHELSEEDDLIVNISVVDIYQSEELEKEGMKYITMRIRINHKDKTLVKETTDEIFKRLNRSLRKSIGAEVK